MRISQTDIEYLDYIRANVRALIGRAAAMYDGGNVLEIGPGGYKDARELFNTPNFYTGDISKESAPDLVIDICYRVGPAEYWKMVICTEVLEHVKDPFAAIRNIYYSMETGGILVLSTPLNFRIHGCGGYDPEQGSVNDYWRFTESGLRLLLKDFEILELKELSSDRGLFPIQYTLIARKR